MATDKFKFMFLLSSVLIRVHPWQNIIVLLPVYPA